MVRPRRYGQGGIAALAVLLLAACLPLAPAPRAPDDRLLAGGRAAYARGEYARAAAIFQDVIARHPGAAVLSEAQWMLAQSYDAQKRVRDALAEYRRFAVNYPTSVHAREARLRIPELEAQLQPPAPARSEGAGGVETTVHTTDARLDALRAQGVGLLVVAVAGGGADGEAERAGVWFRSQLAPVLGDALAGFVTRAHARGFRVLARVPVRDLPWLGERGAWLDRRAEPGGALAPVGWLNLWEPEVQRYLAALYVEVAAAGVDGLIMFDDVATDPADEMNAAARAGFAAAFGRSVAPADLSPTTKGGAFWRWAGWKVRERLQILRRVVEPARAAYPRLGWCMVFPMTAASAPHRALGDYGLDALEARLAGVDQFGLLVDGTDALGAAAAARALATRLGSAAGVTVVIRTVDAAGRPVAAAELERFTRALAELPGVGVLSTRGAFRRAVALTKTVAGP